MSVSLIIIFSFYILGLSPCAKIIAVVLYYGEDVTSIYRLRYKKEYMANFGSCNILQMCSRFSHSVTMIDNVSVI